MRRRWFFHDDNPLCTCKGVYPNIGGDLWYFPLTNGGFGRLTNGRAEIKRRWKARWSALCFYKAASTASPISEQETSFCASSQCRWYASLVAALFDGVFQLAARALRRSGCNAATLRARGWWPAGWVLFCPVMSGSEPWDGSYRLPCRFRPKKHSAAYRWSY